MAKPEPSLSVKAKKKARQTPDGLPVQSFHSLLANLASQARVTYSLGNADATFDQLSAATPLQQRAFDLLAV